MPFLRLASIGLPAFALALHLIVQLAAQAPASPASSTTNVATAEEVQTRCGTVCHKLPLPDILPRAAWRDELVRMMLIQEGVPEPAGFEPLHPAASRLAARAPLLRGQRADGAPRPGALARPGRWRLRPYLEDPVGREPGAGHRERAPRRPRRRRPARHRRERHAPRIGPRGPARKKFALEPIAELRHPAAHRARRSRSGRPPRSARRRPGIVPTRRSPERIVALAAANEGWPVHVDRARRGVVATGGRQGRRLRRRQGPRHRRRDLRMAEDGQHHRPRKRDQGLEGSGVQADGRR